MLLKVLLIIWLINFVVRIFVRNYLSNDILQAGLYKMYGPVTKTAKLFIMSSVIMYILGLVIIIMAILKF